MRVSVFSGVAGFPPPCFDPPPDATRNPPQRPSIPLSGTGGGSGFLFQPHAPRPPAAHSGTDGGPGFTGRPDHRTPRAPPPRSPSRPFRPTPGTAARKPGPAGCPNRPKHQARTHPPFLRKGDRQSEHLLTTPRAIRYDTCSTAPTLNRGRPFGKGDGRSHAPNGLRNRRLLALMPEHR